MGFGLLLSAIGFLLLLSALAGFALGYWWFKRNYEVITDHQMRQSSQTSQVDLSPIQQRLKGVEDSVRAIRIRDEDLNPVTRRLDRIENRIGAPTESISALSTKLSGMRTPDMRPVEERLERVEYAIRNLKMPETDLGSVHSSLALLEMAINDKETPEVNLGRVYNQFTTVENKIDNLTRSIRESREMEMDSLKTQITRVNTNLSDMIGTTPRTPSQTVNLAPVFERLAGLEKAVMSLDRTQDVDFTEVNDRLELIELKLAEPLEFDVPSNEREFEVLFDRLQGMEQTIADKLETRTDMLPILRRMEDLENSLRAPRPEIDVVIGRIASLEDSLRMFEPKPVDLSGLYARFAGIEQAVESVRRDASDHTGLEQVERRLSSLQETLLSIEVPEVDYSPLISSLQKVETSVDLGPLEDRLRSIELNLSALSRDMKSNTETTTITADIRERRRPLVRTETRSYEQTNYRDTNDRYSRDSYSSRRSEDALADARRPGDRANLLVRPAFGTEDDLQRINGVGPMLRDLLNDIGVYYYWQVAEWTPENVEYVDGLLQHFKGRIDRDNWVDQAARLQEQSGAARNPGRYL